MPSVALRILQKLQTRVCAIRGDGAMINDLQGRVFLSRPSYNLAAEFYPAVFIARRTGGGSQIDRRPGADTHSDNTITFDVVGVVGVGDESSIAAENMLADLYRALQLPGDLYLRDDDLNANLLSDPIFIGDEQLEPAPDDFPFELAAIGVTCTYPQTYGDPDDVQR